MCASIAIVAALNNICVAICNQALINKKLFEDQNKKLQDIAEAIGTNNLTHDLRELGVNICGELRKKY